MGIVAFEWAEGKTNQLTLLMNRDNWENRVISGASWSRNGQILSGRCKANNGTWFGITKGGRVAFLVNTSLLLDRVKSYSGSELYPVRFLEVWFVSISSFHLLNS
ncbi:putative transport and Golgi organization protein [Arabidopsis thaliana]